MGRRSVVVWCSLLGVLSLSATALSGQKVDDSIKQAFSQMESLAGGPLEVSISPLTGLATFVAAKAGRALPLKVAASVRADERAVAFLSSHGLPFGIQDKSQVQIIRIRQADEVGIDHVRLQQLHKGIPVTGGELTVHLRGSDVVAVNAKTVGGLENVDTLPKVMPEDVLNSARGLLEKHFGITDAAFSAPRLEIFNRGLLEGTVHPARLAWFIEAVTFDRREFIWIDAHTGGVLLHFNQANDALNRSIWDAKGTPTLPGALVLSEGGSLTGDSDVDNAYRYSGDTYNYFFSQHGRDSSDNSGAPLISTVRYCPSASSCPYQNAFWNGTQAVYGQGMSAADDVVAHELMHAITERTAKLFYYMQSGALNESYSDIFGETIDLTNNGGNDSSGVRWSIGEDLPGIGAIRNMMNPPAHSDPGKMTDSQFVCNRGGFSSSDAGGIHSNNGVPNHAYALMVDGGSYNGFAISGIGLTKAAKIHYRALTQYLLSGSDFLDNYNALRQSCSDLIGVAGITAGDCAEVKKALDAVEMFKAWPCLPNQPAVPESCGTGQTRTNLFLDDLENTGSGNWSTAVLSGVKHWFYPSFWLFATSGVQNFLGYGSNSAGDSVIAMTHDVFISGSGAFLQFNHSYGFEDGPSEYFDGGVIEYSVNGGATWADAGSLISAGAKYGGTIGSNFGNPLGGRPAFVGESFGYTASRLNLSTLAGQNVRFRFRMGTDSSVDDYGWYIDDIAIYQCSGTGGSSKAQLTSPTPGSTLTSSSVTFSWTPGSGVSQYWLYVGTTPGGAQIYGQSQGTNLSATVSGLPTNGSLVYVRLWSQIGGSWQFNDATYTTATAATPVKAQITSPAPGSTLAATTITFAWSTGTSVSGYRLDVGTSPGGSQIYSQSLGVNLSATVSGLPANGSTVYVRLWSQISSVWQFNDYSYTAMTSGGAPAKGQITSPPPGATLTSSTVTFVWNTGSGVSQYWLYLGTTPGGTQIYNQSQGANLSATVSGLPTNGSIVYVRLWSQISGAWQFNDVTYTAASAGGTGAKAQITNPTPGSTLGSSTVTFAWNSGTGVSQYRLDVGTTAGGAQIYSQSLGTNLSATVAGLPTNGSAIYVRLWSQIGGAWQFNDYNFTAASAGTSVSAQLTSPPPGSQLASSTVTFAWNTGTGVSRYWLYVGTTPGGNQIYSQSQGTNLSGTVSGIPTNGSTIYVRLWSLISGVWQYNDYTYTGGAST